MANLKKKSRTDLEKYIRELETELHQAPNAPANANPMHSEGTFSKEFPIIDKPVLVVEDDEGLSTLIEKTLKKAGQQVTHVKTGAEAIEKVRTDPNYLLLLDYGLPDMTGAQLIQNLEEYQQTIPFVMMTGSGNERTAVQMMKLGARDYLIKDSDILNVLPGAIRRVMRELSTETRLVQLEKALRETQQHLHSVINTTPIILWSLNKDGLVTLSEGRALEQLGLEPGQIVGQSVFDIYATDPEALEAIQRCMEGEEFSIDIEVGGCIWNNHYTPIFDEQSNVVGVIGISIDTTDRKQAIEALRQSEEKYRHLIENTNDLVYAADAKGTVTYIGPQAALYGYTPEEVISKNILEFIAKQDHGRITKEFTQTMQTGMVFNSQFRLIDKGGNTFWVEDHANTINDESGHITGISGTLRDITDRKQAEDRLRANEIKFRTIFENASDLIVCLDESGTIVEVNDRIEEIFGFKPEEVIGNNFAQLTYLAPDNKQKAIKLSDNIIGTGIAGLTEIEASHKDGSKLIVEASNRIIQTMDGQQNVLAIIRDITERVQSQEALRESEEKFRTIFENVTDTIAYVDMSGNIIDINSRVKDISGYEPNELIGKNFADLGLINIASLKEIARTFGDTLDGFPTRSIQIGINHKNDSKIVAETSPSLLKLIDGTEGILVVIRDITERKQVEEALLDSQEKLQTMFDTISDAINVTNLQGNIIDVNLASPATFGFSCKEEIIGHYASEFIAKHDQTRLLEHMEQTLKQGHGDTKEYRIVKYTGEEFDAEVNAAVLRDGSGEPIAFMSITRDITERKQSRQSLENKVEELERYKNVTINRELKMIELKGMIRDLEDKFQKPKIEE